MSWEEVKEHGKVSVLEHIVEVFNRLEVQVLIGIFFLGIIIATYIFYKKEKLNRKEILEFRSVWFWVIAVFMLLLIVITYPWGVRIMKSTEHYRKWIQIDVVPYINSLPDTKREVTQLLTFTPDEKKTKDYTFNNLSLYEKQIKNIKDDDLLMVEFMYKSENNVVNMYKGSAYIQYEKDRTIPTVIFKKLEHGLGNGITEGFYAPILYLPQDFNIQENWSKEEEK